MRLEHQQIQTQRQQLMLSPQMQMALQMLQMNSIELDQYIEQSMESNPFLERADGGDPDAQELPPVTAKTMGADEERLEAHYEQGVLGRSEATVFEPFHDDAGRADGPGEGLDFSRNPDLDEAWQYYQDSITRSESLRAHLLDQLQMAVDSPRVREIGECIVGDINEAGYFTGSLDEIARELGVPSEEVARVLEIIKKFEPTGVGAENVQECLLLQIESEYPEETELRILVENHLNDLSAGRISQIAKAMKISPERVVELRKMLSMLRPRPGREYGSEPPAYITPEVVVETVDNDYVVALTSDRMSRLQINKAYIRELRTRKASPGDEAFIQEKVGSAKLLIRNIERRKETIRKTAQAIVDAQREFMGKGGEYMKPLTLEEIAKKVGVHESTVSRTVSGKYIQTPQGLFELKYFFSSGLRSDRGDDQSAVAVSAQIAKIIDQEDKRKPLSDEKIAETLNRQGVHVARRTVAKYREQMQIFPAKLRKTY